MHYSLRLAVVLFFLGSWRLSLAADAPDWREWRGPQGSGSIEQGNYPVKFGADRFLVAHRIAGQGLFHTHLARRDDLPDVPGGRQ